MSLPRRCPNLGGEIRTKPVNRKRAIHTLVAVKYVLPAEARPPSQNFALDVYTAQFFGSDINYDYWGARTNSTGGSEVSRRDGTPLLQPVS